MKWLKSTQKYTWTIIGETIRLSLIDYDLKLVHAFLNSIVSFRVTVHSLETWNHWLMTHAHWFLVRDRLFRSEWYGKSSGKLSSSTSSWVFRDWNLETVALRGVTGDDSVDVVRCFMVLASNLGDVFADPASDQLGSDLFPALLFLLWLIFRFSLVRFGCSMTNENCLLDAWFDKLGFVPLNSSVLEYSENERRSPIGFILDRLPCVKVPCEADLRNGLIEFFGSPSQL